MNRRALFALLAAAPLAALAVVKAKKPKPTVDGIPFRGPHSLTVRDIRLALNKLRLHAGYELSDVRYYEVRPGDGLYAIVKSRGWQGLDRVIQLEDWSGSDRLPWRGLVGFGPNGEKIEFGEFTATIGKVPYHPTT